MTEPGPEDRARWHAFIGIPDCPCPTEWRALGVLDRISMGKGWVRMSTDPACPHHGDSAPPPRELI